MLAYLVLMWIPFGFTTALWTLDGGSGLALVLVGGAGVMGFLYARRFGLRELMTTSMLAFIIALWVWAVDQGGVLGAIVALAATAGILILGLRPDWRLRGALGVGASAGQPSEQRSESSMSAVTKYWPRIAAGFTALLRQADFGSCSRRPRRLYRGTAGSGSSLGCRTPRFMATTPKTSLITTVYEVLHTLRGRGLDTESGSGSV